MTPAEIFRDEFGRSADAIEAMLGRLDAEDLVHRPAPGANTIAWLLWHLTRVQDDHVAEVAGREQAWTDEGFAERFALPFPDADIGLGHTPEEVGQVRPSGELLGAYHRAVHARSQEFLATVTEEGLDRVVDERWDPPTTLGVRLVSVAEECAKHVAQAEYLAGLRGKHIGP